MGDRKNEDISGDPNIEFLVIRPARGATEDTVRAYLYTHAHVLGVENQGFGPVLLVMLASMRGVDYLAQYQTERLLSGGHRVQRCSSYAEAWNCVQGQLAQA